MDDGSRVLLPVFRESARRRTCVCVCVYVCMCVFPLEHLCFSGQATCLGDLLNRSAGTIPHFCWLTRSFKASRFGPSAKYAVDTVPCEGRRFFAVVCCFLWLERRLLVCRSPNALTRKLSSIQIILDWKLGQASEMAVTSHPHESPSRLGTPASWALGLQLRVILIVFKIGSARAVRQAEPYGSILGFLP